MKLIHVGDLHLGKRIYEYSMIENQEHVLRQIIELAAQETPDGVLLAGDIYDKSIPSVEATQLFDWFLTELAAYTSIFIISGNHDSPERLRFGSHLLRQQNVFIAGSFEGKLQCETLCDQWGEVRLYLLPYIKPAVVRSYFEEEVVEDCQQAVKLILEGAELDPSQRNVIIAHQFVTGRGIEAERSDSEQMMIGGAENIDVSLFSDFDYVALGHLHGPQRLGRDTVRYGGSILKYSFSEINHKKSVTIVELKEKGNIEIRQVRLYPKYDLRQIKGPIEELLKPEIVALGNPQDYFHVILTDEEPLADPLQRLRTVYPNVMTLSIENSRTKAAASGTLSADALERKSTEQLYREFFRRQNGVEMTEAQCKIMDELIRKAEEKR